MENRQYLIVSTLDIIKSTPEIVDMNGFIGIHLVVKYFNI